MSRGIPTHARRVAVLAATAALALTACNATSADGVVLTDDESEATDATTGADGVGTLSSAEVHEISIEFDMAAYDEMIRIYDETSEKEWIEATVTIDGTTYEQVGLRLKGNSSLRGITSAGGGGGNAGDATADDPSSLPWLIRLDKYVDEQSHDGLTDLVVRSNTSDTALNEAVALELLELAGLASQDAIATAFSVNGSDPVLRLVIDNPDDAWMDEWFDDDGALYKAESTGDYSYRGDDPESYDEVFDQEAGKDDADLSPLIEFLQFVNESDDATFAAELGDHLDVDAFATYLAMQELIDNFDDIDGPGNNSYLYWNAETGRFTVVPWDHNLAFGQGPGAGGGAGGFPGVVPADGDFPERPVGGFGDRPQRPVDGAVPTDGELPAVGDLAAVGDRALPTDGAVPGGGRGGFGGSNVLVERFLSVDGWQTLYEERLIELRAALYESGIAADVLATWSEVVSSSGLVDAATVTAESDSIAAQLT